MTQFLKHGLFSDFKIYEYARFGNVRMGVVKGTLLLHGRPYHTACLTYCLLGSVEVLFFSKKIVR